LTVRYHSLEVASPSSTIDDYCQAGGVSTGSRRCRLNDVGSVVQDPWLGG